jgi:hypothetical protein
LRFDTLNIALSYKGSFYCKWLLIINIFWYTKHHPYRAWSISWPISIFLPLPRWQSFSMTWFYRTLVVLRHSIRMLGCWRVVRRVHRAHMRMLWWAHKLCPVQHLDRYVTIYIFIHICSFNLYILLTNNVHVLGTNSNGDNQYEIVTDPPLYWEIPQRKKIVLQFNNSY